MKKIEVSSTLEFSIQLKTVTQGFDKKILKYKKDGQNKALLRMKKQNKRGAIYGCSLSQSPYPTLIPIHPPPTVLFLHHIVERIGSYHHCGRRAGPASAVRR